ncbi:TetR/AcrR family transcriptional regulator [Fodinicurvata halophila]
MAEVDSRTGKDRKTVTTRDPVRTRRRILQAATEEFAAKGLEGARTDEIARRSGANKRMIYHYFSSKEGLFQAVLEKAYADIRGSEKRLRLTQRDPVDAMAQLVGFSFDWFHRHPEFAKLLNEENLYEGVHVESSAKARSLNMPLVDMIQELLERGEASGQFRSGVDPVQLYISIAGISYFFFSNRFTLSAIFSRDLASRPELEQRRQHVIDVILGYLRQID